MAGWESFLVAQAGASAALAGLVFVGVSINLDTIMTYPSLPDRALEAFVVLVAVLVASTVLLVPGQPDVLAGGEILCVGLAVWSIEVLVQCGVWRLVERPYRRSYTLHIALGQLATVPFVLAGVATLLRGDGGLYWLVPAVIVCYLVALSNAWVLLVEIKR